MDAPHFNKTPRSSDRVFLFAPAFPKIVPSKGDGDLMRRIIAGAVALAGLFAAAPVSAGVYADDVTRCVVKATSDADRLALVRWVFAAMALHPDLKAMAVVTPEDRTQINQTMSRLVERLLTQDCRKETVDAIKYEGSDFLGTTFKSLGEIAMGGLMSNPDVGKGFRDWAATMDTKIFDGLATEAGRPPIKPAQ